MKIVLFWGWMHALWIKRSLPEDHPWKTMTFEEYIQTADAARIELSLSFWGLFILLTGWCWLSWF